MAKSNIGEYLGAAAILVGNGLKFRYLRASGAPYKPTVLSLALTNRCNSHCIMCNIWKRAREHPDIKSLEMSPDQIIDLLSRPLFSGLVELDLTGGEPHLRDDLADIVLGIGKLKKDYLPGLRSIIIASNGLLPRRIISNYEKILEGLKGTNIDLVSVCSLDGIGQTHDLIRGTEGAFKLANETISGLLTLRETHPNYFIGIKTTILRPNINTLDDILDFAVERNLFHIISSAFFTEARFRNIDKKEALTLKPNEYKEVLEFYNCHELENDYFYSRVQGFLATGRRQWACAALHNYLFIDFDGKVYPCEIMSEPIGDVKKQDVADIWNSFSARHWRNRVGKLESCLSCNEPGAIRYSACAEGFSYLKFLLKLGRQKFNETFYQQGFAKYLGK